MCFCAISKAALHLVLFIDKLLVTKLERRCQEKFEGLGGDLCVHLVKARLFCDR